MNQMIKKFSLEELARITDSELSGDPEHEIFGVADLGSASFQDASFLANPRYREAMGSSQAGVVCIDLHTPLISGRNFLISSDPSRCFQKILEVFFPKENQSSGFEGVHPTSVIHPTAKIGKNVNIGPYVVIDKDVEVGDNTCLMSFVSLGPGVKVGTGCLFYPHVIVRERCLIGNQVILQPGAVIGSCGFGYTTDQKGRHHKLEQLGIVIIEDDVEIGANTTIDRARFKTTRISRGTKLDNLVQIGHNVELGQDNIIVSQTGIAGSTKTGRNVVMGGQAGVVGHLEIGDFVMIATRGGVSKSIEKPGKYAGSPVIPLSKYNRQQVLLRNIENHMQELEEIKKRLAALETQPQETS